MNKTICLNPKKSYSNIKESIILIGAAGHQGKEYFNLLKDKYNFIALIDNDYSSLEKIYDSKKYLLLKDIKDLNANIDFEIAIICLPHYLHKNITLSLLSSKKTIIKEKPLALNYNEIKEYTNSMKIYSNIKLFTIVQRNFNPCFIEGKNNLKLIGKIYNFSYDYELNFENETMGWRGEFNKSFGGVLIDMGYHILDIILKFFHGLISASAVNSFCYNDMKKEGLEDSINIVMLFKNDISGVVNINRHSHIKKEIFTIRGEKGIIEILPSQYTIYDRKGNIVLNSKNSKTQEEMKISMFDYYIKNQNNNKFLFEHFRHHCNIVLLIEKIYQQLRNIKKYNKDNLILYQAISLKEDEKSQEEPDINNEKIF
jgi:predicted dehydrogenase